MKNKIVIASFLFVLTVPLVLMPFTKSDSSILIGEKRTLATFPDFPNSWEQIKVWPNAFDLYVKDNIAGRSWGLKLYNSLCYKMGISPKDWMILGQDGWFFNDVKGTLKQYKGLHQVIPVETENFVKVVEAHQNYFEEELNIPFLFFVGPDKHYVYPEYLPKYMEKYEGANQNFEKTRTALLNRGINYLEIPDFIKSKKTRDQLLYLKSDTHWNSQGAFEAYQELMKNIQKQFPNIHILEKEDLKEIQKKRKGDAYQAMGGFEGVIPLELENYLMIDPPEKEVSTLNLSFKWVPFEGSVNDVGFTMKPILIETDQTEAPVLLLVRDSFSDALLPYLEHSFSKIIVVHHRFGQWSLRVFKDHKPDIAVLQIVQRNLNKAFFIPNFAKANKKSRKANKKRKGNKNRRLKKQ